MGIWNIALLFPGDDPVEDETPDPPVEEGEFTSEVEATF
jgi:hypothetical protein